MADETNSHGLIEHTSLFRRPDPVPARGELVWNEDHTAVTVIFHVREGTRYRLASIDVAGAKTLPMTSRADCSRARWGRRAC